MEQLLVTFGDIKRFLDDNGDLGIATRFKLLEVLNDPTKTTILQMELAAIIDTGAPLVKATYKLEGDEALVWYPHDQICTVLNAMTIAHYPNVTAVVERVFAGNCVASQQWTMYAANCVKGAQDYFAKK